MTRLQGLTTEEVQNYFQAIGVILLLTSIIGGLFVTLGIYTMFVYPFLLIGVIFAIIFLAVGTSEGAGEW